MPERHETEVHDEARKMFEEDRRAFQLSIEERRRQERATYIRLLASLGIAMGVVSATLIISFKVVDPTREGMFVNKAGLLERIEKTIQGGADLRAVRQVFNNREKELLAWRMLLGFDVSKNRYREPLSLSTVLEDLRAEAYQRDQPDVALVEKVDPLLKLHEQTNPFDKLAQNQKVDFENVRARLGEQYSTVQQSIERIVNELDKQNQIVSEYLADAKLSLYMSIIALIVAVIALVPSVAEALKWVRRARD